MIQITKAEHGLDREEIIERIMDKLSTEHFEQYKKDEITETQAIELDAKDLDYLNCLDDEELICEYNDNFHHPIRSYYDR